MRFSNTGQLLPNRRFSAFQIAPDMRFERWTVLRKAKRIHRRTYYWMCKCDCGNVRTIRADQLKRGTSKSCGCFAAENTSARSRTHGRSHKGDSTYNSWINLRARCHSGHPRYGGRGITFDPRWNSFAVFLADMGERPSKLHSIERVNNDGPYVKSNCVWALPIVQLNNTRKTRFFEFDGMRLPLRAWSKRLKIPLTCLQSRLRKGWTVKDTFTTPFQGNQWTRRTWITTAH